jgi:hypothetical protein
MTLARSEGTAYQRNQGFEGKGPSQKNVDISLPWGKFKISIALFPGLTKPLYVGSAIKTHPSLLEFARGLTRTESNRANIKFKSEAEGILSGEARQGQVVLLSPDKTSTYKVYASEKNDPKGLYLYYRRGQFEGEPAIQIIAIAKVKDAPKVDDLLTKKIRR